MSEDFVLQYNYKKKIVKINLQLGLATDYKFISDSEGHANRWFLF